MFKLDKLLSFIVVASLVGALLAPIAGMIAKPGPGATQFMFGLIAASGFLVALTCYHLGTGPKRSGAEVGEAVNSAIVVGMALVLAVHAALTFVVYA